MSEPLFNLEKLKIKVFSKRERMSGDEIETFEVMFNPDSYSLHYDNDFSDSQGIDTSATKLNYKASRPRTLDLKLLIDGSGATSQEKGSSQLSVADQIDKFRRLTLEMNGDIHEPNYLIVFWSVLNFKCRLISVDITYNLFDHTGKPLRAELDAHFTEDIDDKERLLEADQHSPDLTHRRVVRSGDTLPLLTRAVYGDSSYYLQVARFNKLNNFRALEVGKQLIFPPVVQL